MKRLLVVAVLAAWFVVPGTALSSTESYSTGSAKRGFTLNFTVFSQNGKPKFIGNISYSGLNAGCDEGGITLSGSGFGTDESGPNRAAKVRNKRFSRTYPAENDQGGDGTFKISGRFRNQNQKITGKIRATGDFPDVSRTNCDSGAVRYVTE